MSHQCTDQSFINPSKTFSQRGLLQENARLRRLCAESKEIVARHELLLREGDHRIKNSLQIVASLISLQARRESNEAVRGALMAAVARVQAIARIHDALQLSAGKDVVDLGELVDTMCKSLQTMAGDPLAVEVIVDAEQIEAPLSLAQPLALAVNELVVNALRHAFPDGRSGIVRVNVTRKDGEVCVVVADDGVGLPADHAEGRGYGMRLVHMMAAKLKGALKVENGVGARFTLSAPHA
jgi:two-component sensor histidine kinase